MMTEQKKEAEIAETEPKATETEAKTIQPTETKVETAEEVKAELERTQVALKKANSEAAKRRKQLDAFEKAEQERKDAELSETERLKKELDESQTKLERLNYQQLQRSIADDIGLPAAFANRIQGDDAEAMKEDAKQLLEAMPKQDKKTIISPTNPGEAKQGMTDNQRRAQLYRGDVTDPFDAESARQKGGGVHFITPE